MSYIIRPEDVSQSILELAKERFEEASWNRVTPQNVADFLQDCLEAGIVSPPCHVKRYLGELECQGGTINPQLFFGKPKEEGDEHWKGQTE